MNCDVTHRRRLWIAVTSSVSRALACYKVLHFVTTLLTTKYKFSFICTDTPWRAPAWSWRTMTAERLKAWIETYLLTGFVIETESLTLTYDWKVRWTFHSTPEPLKPLIPPPPDTPWPEQTWSWRTMTAGQRCTWRPRRGTWSWWSFSWRSARSTPHPRLGFDLYHVFKVFMFFFIMTLNLYHVKQRKRVHWNTLIVYLCWQHFIASKANYDLVEFLLEKCLINPAPKVAFWFRLYTSKCVALRNRATLEMDSECKNKNIGFYPKYLRPFLRIVCVIDDYACR